MDAGTLRGIATVVALLGFLAVAWWAFSARQKERFDAAARLPLEEDPVNREDK
jgi:cytochrome c oxidase cbb3-type subunit 4